MILHEPWEAEALCAQIPGADGMFFPPKSGSGQTDKAKKICDLCPVSRECYEFSIRTRQKFGVWGGVSAAERKAAMPKERLCKMPYCDNMFELNEANDRSKYCSSECARAAKRIQGAQYSERKKAA